MATNLVKAKKGVKEMKSTKGREVVEEEGRSMDIFAPAWVQNNARVLKAKTSPPKTGSEDDKEKKNKTIEDKTEAEAKAEGEAEAEAGAEVEAGAEAGAEAEAEVKTDVEA